MKRWIFFISYIIFFTAVPVGVYYLWPANVPNGIQSLLDMQQYDMTDVNPNDRWGEHHINSDSTIDSLSPYLSLDLHWQDSVKRIADSIDKANGVQHKAVQQQDPATIASEYNRDMKMSVEGIYRTQHFLVAAPLCLFVSLLFGLILSILKMNSPLQWSGGLIIGISVFNLFYVELMFYFVIYLTGGFAVYTFFYSYMFLLTGVAILIELFCILIFILTIIFGIVGIIKAKRLRSAGT